MYVFKYFCVFIFVLCFLMKLCLLYLDFSLFRKIPWNKFCFKCECVRDYKEWRRRNKRHTHHTRVHTDVAAYHSRCEPEERRGQRTARGYTSKLDGLLGMRIIYSWLPRVNHAARDRRWWWLRSWPLTCGNLIFRQTERESKQSIAQLHANIPWVGQNLWATWPHIAQFSRVNAAWFILHCLCTVVQGDCTGQLTSFLKVHAIACVLVVCLLIVDFPEMSQIFL